MAIYKLSKVAKEDLIRIHNYGVKKFGTEQADKYFDSLFEHFEIKLSDSREIQSHTSAQKTRGLSDILLHLKELQ